MPEGADLLHLTDAAGAIRAAVADAGGLGADVTIAPYDLGDAIVRFSATAYVTGSTEEATVATHDKAMAAARAAFEAAEQHGVKPDDCVSLATQVLPTVG